MTKILAVDDQQINLDILREMLEGYLVETAVDGLRAIEVALDFLPDVVLLDVMMPQLDGLETCRRLRRIPALEHSRIIMVSAKAMESERAAGIDAGADDYLTKPFDEAELMAAICQNSDAHRPRCG